MENRAGPPITQQVTFIYVNELERSCRFYADVVGLEPVLDQGACRIFRVCGEAFVGVCRVRGGRSVSPGGVVLTLVTAEVDAWHARLLAAGADLLGPPASSEAFKVYGFFVRDPDGHLVEFQRFLDPRWPAPGA